MADLWKGWPAWSAGIDLDLREHGRIKDGGIAPSATYEARSDDRGVRYMGKGGAGRDVTGSHLASKGSHASRMRKAEGNKRKEECRRIPRGEGGAVT